MDLNKFSKEYFKDLDEWSVKKANGWEEKDPVSYFKMKKKTDKILDFWEKEMPDEWHFMTENSFYREAAIEIAEEFLDDPRNINRDFKFFPWKEKIEKKMNEMFGLKLVKH